MQKNKEIKLVITNTPLKTGSTPAAKAASSAPSSSVPFINYLKETPEELGKEYRKCHQEIIPDSEKGVGIVWKTHLPRDYPDSLRVYFLGYTNMQHNLTPSTAECAKYSREAFRMTSIAEGWKLVEVDPLEVLGLMMHYQYHFGVITGTLWDRYEKKALRLEAPPLGVSQSSAAVIDRDLYKDQMLTRNLLANIRLEEIRASKREIENFKGTMQKQHITLTQKEEDLEKA